MTVRSGIALILPILALGACTQDRPAGRPVVAPAAEAIGEAVKCIPTSQISATHIRDDWTIDFEGPGGKVWRNTRKHRCPGLKTADAFSYSPTLNQLCNTDLIHVLDRVGGVLEEGAGCGLGKFVPVKLGED